MPLNKAVTDAIMGKTERSIPASPHELALARRALLHRTLKVALVGTLGIVHKSLIGDGLAAVDLLFLQKVTLTWRVGRTTTNSVGASARPSLPKRKVLAELRAHGSGNHLRASLHSLIELLAKLCFV